MGGKVNDNRYISHTESAEIAEIKENPENPFVLVEAMPLMLYLYSFTCKQAFR